MKYQDFVPFYQKLNFRCPKGTVDETFSCGKTPKEAKQNYEKIQKEKTKTSKQVPEKRTSAQMDAKDIIRRIQSGRKITLEEKNYVQRLLAGELPEPIKVVPAPVKKLETVITKAKKEIASGKVSEKTKKELKSSIQSVKKVESESSPNAISLLISTSDAILNSLNTKQKDTIEEYSSITHMPINSYLWSGKITNYDSEHKMSETQVKNKIAELDSVFDKSETPEDSVVYRGIPEETFVKMKDLFKAGTEYETPSYTSTTHDKDRAKTFARGKHTATMEIRIPKGSRALALENTSNFKAEKEVLIDRGAKFKVLEVKTKKIHGGAFSETKVIVEMIPNRKTKQNSSVIKSNMKHPGNWSTSESLDSKIKKELASGIQDVIAILKSVKYFKEDPKEVALNEAYKQIAQGIFDTHVKLNTNCKQEEKVGEGPGSCSGGLKDSINSSKVDLHPKLSPGDFDSMLKASKAIRNDKSEPDKVLRRMMAEEVERKFVRETKEAVQATKESNDEFIKNSGNDTWNKLSSESQSAIRGYTASDYGVINSALAEGIERPEVALIKAAMKPLEKETILYRGVSFDLPKEVIKFGTIWENKPFASCSTGSFIAEEAALGKLTHDGVAKIPTVLEILTSKNTKGFAVGKNSFHAVADAGSEVILDTGTKFQTLSVDKSGGIRKITVRVVDD